MINLERDEALAVLEEGGAPFDVLAYISPDLRGTYELGGVYVRHGRYLDKCVGISRDGLSVYFRELRRLD